MREQKTASAPAERKRPRVGTAKNQRNVFQQPLSVAETGADRRRKLAGIMAWRLEDQRSGIEQLAFNGELRPRTLRIIGEGDQPTQTIFEEMSAAVAERFVALRARAAWLRRRAATFDGRRTGGGPAVAIVPVA